MAGGIFKQFNSFLDRIFRGTENAQIVGFHKQIVGEFPADVKPDRLYEFYHGWAAVHTAVNVTHQKFMGAGIQISSKSKKFDYVFNTWWQVVQADKKVSQMFLSGWITGNGIIERQYVEDGRLGNIEHIPMTPIYKIFRDSYGNELKLQQLVDGVLLDLDPKYYGHWMINNPDRQAFGKSIYHSVAVPRKITQKVDPLTGVPVNAERTTISLLDAQAKLQAAEVEIKDKMAKPKIFALFKGMPEQQLAQIQSELEDGNSDQYAWAFNADECTIEEVHIDPSSRYDQYNANVNEQIDMAMSFGSKVITHPGGFGYASAQTSVDVLDQYVAQIQSEAIEFIRNEIVRPFAESWGWRRFDDLEVKIVFLPSVRKLNLEDIITIPNDVLSVREKRKMLEELNIELHDDLYEEDQQQTQQSTMDGMMKPKTPLNNIKFRGGPPRTTPERPPIEKEMPKPDEGSAKLEPPSARSVEYLLKHPDELISYIDQIVEAKVEERALLNPQGTAKADHDDQFMGRIDTKKPEITNPEIALRLVQDQEDPNNPLSIIGDDDFTEDPSIPGLDYDRFDPSSKKKKQSPDQLPIAEEPTAITKRKPTGGNNIIG